MDVPPPVPAAVPIDDLEPGERIRWQGRGRAQAMRSSFAIWLFAIPWTAFALFWETLALSPWIAPARAGGTSAGTLLAGIVMPLFGVPFVLVGLWMLARPFALMRRAGRTVYALTDRRLIRRVEGRTTEVESISLDRLGAITTRERRDGSGDLSVQTGRRIDSDGDRVNAYFKVDGVADVAGLRRLLSASTQD
ncbi:MULTISPECIES: hypothetical protein [Sphingomonas]|jgi:hypothetical protein|uniref:hypothetical protein n=1 Tax=Sphingomonas TaxID=13687 RepID=UPI000836FF80|nr:MULTISPECIES: hypothetical protein [Sphingomonas]MBY0301533.1 hypothetical protein [Sphingomonas ginsenosidimutans]